MVAKEKSKWIRENNLGGIMFWSVDNDDFRGSCHGKPFPLIEAAKTAYYTSEGLAATSKYSTSAKISSSKSSSSRNRFLNPRRTTTPEPPSTTTEKSITRRRNSRNKNNKQKQLRRRLKPKKLTTTEEPTTSTTTTTEAPAIDPLRTPAPPTTPDPGVDFECKDEGFFPHPRECKKYFWCLDAPGLGLVAHHFTCPAGLYFNKLTDSCDYSRNVPCKPGGTTTTTTTTTTEKPTTTTTTTTKKPTTQPPEEEEDEYEYYYDEEEPTEDEEPIKSSKTTGNSKILSSSDIKFGKSVKEVNDIKDLLGIIKKFGGVDALEKYLAENPGVADQVEYEYDDEEPSEEVTSSKPLSSTTRSRFSSSNPLRSRSSSNNNPVTLRYTTIKRQQQARKAAASAEIAESQPLIQSADDDEEPQPKRSVFSTQSNRPRSYTTLTRGRNTLNNKDKGTSTETSVVVRYSDEEDRGADRYVVISRPYAKVSSGSALFSDPEESVTSSGDPLVEGQTVVNDDTDSIDEGDLVEVVDNNHNSLGGARLRYVSLPRQRITNSNLPATTTKDDLEDDEEEYEYESDEPETPTTTTTTTSKPSRIRIPTRKTSGNFLIRSRGSSTAAPLKVISSRQPTIFVTSTSRPETTSLFTTNRRNRNFSVANRRSPLFNRTRSTTTPSTDESISPSSQQFRTTSTDSPVQSSSLGNSIQPVITRFKSRPRFRTTPAPNIVFSSPTTLQPLPGTFQAAIIRRRTRRPPIIISHNPPKSTTTTTTEPSTTLSTTTSTTPRPTTRRLSNSFISSSSVLPTTSSTSGKISPSSTFKYADPFLDNGNDYYYYVYEDELDGNDDILTKSQSRAVTPKTTAAQVAAQNSKQFSRRTLDVSGSSNEAIDRDLNNIKNVKNELKSSSSTSSSSSSSKNKNISTTSPKDKNPSSHQPSATVPLSSKIRMNLDGSIECFDKGIYPHPTSCKQFVHCAPKENGQGIRAWIYSCPKLLTFDPIGGMCNWPALKKGGSDKTICYE